MKTDVQKLKKLENEMNEAFNEKQQAWQEKKKAYKKVIILVDDCNERLWDTYKRICANITIYKTKGDEQYEKMVECFEQSQEAYSAGDGALAKVLSIRGHEHQENLNIYNKQVQDLCKMKIEEENFAKNHKLPKNVDKLLDMDTTSFQIIIARGNLHSEFLQTLRNAEKSRDKFNLLHKEFKQKQALYKSYKQYGEDMALNDMEETSDNWDPYIRGWIEDRAVTVRTGKTGTKNAGETLIADGHLSGKEFARKRGEKGHNHYGRNKNSNYTGKFVEDIEGDRGKYTGPGH